MSPFERTLTLGLSIIGCAAAVIVIPEVRCAAGLDSAMECTDGFGAAPLLPGPSAGATLRLERGEDPRIGPIRERFQWIENHARRFARSPLPLQWGGADSASAIVYVEGGGIPKITARVWRGSERTVLKFYYDGPELVFIHQIVQTMPGETEQYQQRFYFERGRMFRWLGPTRTPISDGEPEFANNSRYLSTLGQHLLSTVSRLPRSGT